MVHLHCCLVNGRGMRECMPKRGFLLPPLTRPPPACSPSPACAPLAAVFKYTKETDQVSLK